jgi:hypothetical protein
MPSHSPTGRKGRRFVGGLVVAVALAVVLSLTASSATHASQATSQAKFRQQYAAYLLQLQQVAKVYEATPQGRAAFATLKFNPSTAMVRARKALAQATPAQLAVLQKATGAYPAWRTIPGRLATLTARFHKGARFTRMITPDDCATARAAGYTQTDVEAAADASLAADVILEAIPNDVLGEPVRIIAVIAWAIPQGIQRGFEHLYDIASACDDADHQALVQQNLDVAVSTRATQSSVNTLTTNFNALNTLINARLDVAVSSRATQTSLDGLIATVNSLNTLVNSNLDAKVSSRATQASLTAFNTEFTANATTVNTKLDSANTKLDSLSIAVSDNGKLALRLQIEKDLSEPGNHPIALFEVPASSGGYLDLTRDIVVDTMAKMQAIGQGVGNAQAFVASADAAVTAHAYKTAYADYGKAYRAAAG